MMALTEMLQPTLLAVMFKGTLVLVLAAVACFLLRRSSASGRYLVWASALVVLIALPILPALFPAWYVPVNADILASHFNTATPVSRPAAPGSGTEETGAPMDIAEVNGEEAAPVTPVPSVENDPAGATNGAHSGAISRMTRANSAALVIWLIGSVAVLARLGFGFIGIWWIARRAKPVTDPGLLDLTHELSEQRPQDTGAPATEFSTTYAHDMGNHMAGDPRSARRAGMVGGPATDGTPARVGPCSAKGLPGSIRSLDGMQPVLDEPARMGRSPQDAHRARARMRRSGARLRLPRECVRRTLARRGQRAPRCSPVGTHNRGDGTSVTF